MPVYNNIYGIKLEIDENKLKNAAQSNEYIKEGYNVQGQHIFIKKNENQPYVVVITDYVRNDNKSSVVNKKSEIYICDLKGTPINNYINIAE